MASLSLRWRTPPRISLLWFSGRREAFSHAVETRPKEWVLLAVLSGRFRYVLGRGQPGICLPGEFVLCPPGVPLHREALEEMVFYSLRFRWNPPSPNSWRGRRVVRDITRLDSTLANLEAAFNATGQNGAAAWADHLLDDLLHQAAYEMEAESPSPHLAPDRIMLKVSEGLRTQLARTDSLQEIAHELRITPFQLSRRFRAAFGVSPNVFRTRARVQHARKLLLETDWKTERIAEECGFDNAFYFSRVFKKQTGLPPREFRQRNRI